MHVVWEDFMEKGMLIKTLLSGGLHESVPSFYQVSVCLKRQIFSIGNISLAMSSILLGELCDFTSGHCYCF